MIQITTGGWFLVALLRLLLRPIQFNNLVDIIDCILGHLAGHATLGGAINMELFTETPTSKRNGLPENLCVSIKENAIFHLE